MDLSPTRCLLSVRRDGGELYVFGRGGGGGGGKVKGCVKTLVLGRVDNHCPYDVELDQRIVYPPTTTPDCPKEGRHKP